MADEQNLKERLTRLHNSFLDSLIRVIESEEATAADRTLAWKVLLDNGVRREDLGGLAIENAEVPKNLPWQPSEEDLEEHAA